LAFMAIFALIFSRGNLNLLGAVFGFHLVFNEIYLLHRTNLRPLWHRLGLLRTASCVFSLLLYAIAVRQVFFGFQFIYMPVCVLAAAAGIVFLYALIKARPALTTKTFIDLCSLEIMACVIVGISMFTKIGVFEVVLYHITLWGIYPMTKMWKSPKAVISYVFYNVLGFMTMLHLSPLSAWPYHFTFLQMLDQFKFWSFVHIFTAISISSAHPDWIIRLLQPTPALAAIVPKTFRTTMPEIFGTVSSGKIVEAKSVK
ncbi:MAG: hypothetical protein IAF58_12425, partial [Leptolyngbya sp.]|nr:hypothetical protein [Candidatus Melainabacteria bacterium]